MWTGRTLNITSRPFEYFDDPEGTRTVDIENRRFLTLGLADAFTSVLSFGGQYKLGSLPLTISSTHVILVRQAGVDGA